MDKVRMYPKGKISGPGTSTSDSIPALLSNGEYVLPAEAVQMVGENNLDRLRAEALRRRPVKRFSEGGTTDSDSFNSSDLNFSLTSPSNGIMPAFSNGMMPNSLGSLADSLANTPSSSSAPPAPGNPSSPGYPASPLTPPTPTPSPQPPSPPKMTPTPSRPPINRSTLGYVERENYERLMNDALSTATSSTSSEKDKKYALAAANQYKSIIGLADGGPVTSDERGGYFVPDEKMPFKGATSPAGEAAQSAGNSLYHSMNTLARGVSAPVSGLLEGAGWLGAKGKQWFGDPRTNASSMTDSQMDDELARRKTLSQGPGGLSETEIRQSLGVSPPSLSQSIPVQNRPAAFPVADLRTKTPATSTPPTTPPAASSTYDDEFKQLVGLAPPPTFEEQVGLPKKPPDTPPAATPPGDSLAGATWNVANPDRPLPADVKERGDKIVNYMGAKDQGWNSYLASPDGGIAKDGSVMTQQEAGPVTGTTTRNYRVMGVNGEASGVVPMSRGTGGFAGSANDAEAARNWEARLEQDRRADYEVERMNKAADMERNYRAERLGISRGTLDRMEGRVDTPAAQAAAAAQSAPSSSSPGSLWDRPGDGFGDAAFRENRYNRLVDEAANERGFGARRRSERKLAAAQAMLAPYLDAYKTNQAAEASRNSLAGQVASSQASLAGQRYSADAGLRGRQIDAEASRYGSLLTSRTQADKNRLEAEQKNEELTNQREDVITRRAALTSKQPSGLDQLALEKVNLSRAYAAAKTDADRQAIARQASILGVTIDPVTAAMSAVEQTSR